MKHEKTCKRCGVAFVGFTPVCKECNLKGPEESASQAKAENDNAATKVEQPPVPNMPGALSSVPRRSQKNNHDANDSMNNSTGSSFPQQKNIFNNNNYHRNHNNNDQNDYYSNSSAFGNGFNRKKKPQDGNPSAGHNNNTNGGQHHNNNYHGSQSDRVPDAFARIGKNHPNQRHQGQSHRTGNYNNASGDSNGNADHNNAPRAFDFRNNRNQRSHNNPRHVNHQQDGNFGDRMAYNNEQQAEERDNRNPFVHLQKVCESHKEGNCVYGDRCRFLHSKSTPNAGKSVKADRSNISKEGFGVRL